MITKVQGELRLLVTMVNNVILCRDTGRSYLLLIRSNCRDIFITRFMALNS